DYQSRKILLGILTDTEEDHAYWLEKQLKLIEQLGLQNYLQSQA
ncbi:MAG: bacterioferritin, partial [Pseudanabaena sp.]